MKTIIYALISTLMLSTYVNAETVTVVADPWPPFIDEEHPEGGVGIQIIREALGRNGYDIEVTIMPWARAEAGVRAGTFDVLPGTWYTEERAEDLLFSDHYMVNEVKFIKRVTDDFQYSGLDSVTGKTVAVILDYGYGDAFYAGDFKRDATTSFASNIQKLIHNRVDLTLEDELVGRFSVNQTNPEWLDQIEFMDPPLSANTLHLASGYANPRHNEIVDAFNAGLAAMREDGTFDAIMKANNLQ